MFDTIHGVADREDTNLVWQVFCLITELTKGMAGSEEADLSPTFRYEWKFSGCRVLSLQSQPIDHRRRISRSNFETLQGGHGVSAQWYH